MSKNKTFTLIYGAGTAGIQLSKALEIATDFEILGFVDDDPKLTNTLVSGRKVYPPDNINELIKLKNVDQVIFAILNISSQQRASILKKLSKLNVDVSIMPSFGELLRGKSFSDLKEINVSQLLGRSVVEPSKELIEQCLKNKSICVTGAGGSIGSEIAMQALASGVSKLILFELSEAALHSIYEKLVMRTNGIDNGIEIVPVLGSVLDKNRFHNILKKFQVETVFHSAAYKHVPLVEQNIIPSVENNVLGTLNAGLACQNTNVERFVLISTDKAVRATNIMGATKRLAELCVQYLGQGKYSSPTFCSVRFGNVLGSSGSVVPIFNEQIKTGGPVTVTHPDIIRYFMTISEAASLVIQAGAISKGQEVFILDMGDPIKILDLAKKMISLNGLTIKDTYNPHGDIEIIFSGIRPGEKLFEELLVGSEAVKTLHPKIMCENNSGLDIKTFKNTVLRLEKAIDHKSLDEVLEILKETVEDYRPNSGIIDHLQQSFLI